MILKQYLPSVCLCVCLKGGWGYKTITDRYGEKLAYFPPPPFICTLILSMLQPAPSIILSHTTIHKLFTPHPFPPCVCVYLLLLCSYVCVCVCFFVSVYTVHIPYLIHTPFPTLHTYILWNQTFYMSEF